MYLFCWSIWHSGNKQMEGWEWKKSVIGTFCVVLIWTISFHGWRECPLLKYPWAKYCNDLSVVAVHKDVLCASIILFNACACRRLLLKLALWNQQQWTKNRGRDQGFNRKRCFVILQEKNKTKKKSYLISMIQNLMDRFQLLLERVEENTRGFH